jgi:hypothetical protein
VGTTHDEEPAANETSHTFSRPTTAEAPAGHKAAAPPSVLEVNARAIPPDEAVRANAVTLELARWENDFIESKYQNLPTDMTAAAAANCIAC